MIIENHAVIDIPVIYITLFDRLYCLQAITERRRKTEIVLFKYFFYTLVPPGLDFNQVTLILGQYFTAELQYEAVYKNMVVHK